MENFFFQFYQQPTRSRGIRRSSEPCFRNTSPAVCDGFIPIPSSVMIADVDGFCLNYFQKNKITKCYFNKKFIKNGNVPLRLHISIRL